MSKQAISLMIVASLLFGAGAILAIAFGEGHLQLVLKEWRWDHVKAAPLKD